MNEFILFKLNGKLRCIILTFIIYWKLKTNKNGNKGHFIVHFNGFVKQITIIVNNDISLFTIFDFIKFSSCESLSVQVIHKFITDEYPIKSNPNATAN